MPETDRRHLPIPPEHGVTPDVPRDIAALANALDNVAFDLEGTLADRPGYADVPGGTYYFDTDHKTTTRARADGWYPVSGTQGYPGDLKASLQAADHGPWLVADGRRNVLRADVSPEFAALMDAFVAAGKIPAAIDADHLSLPDWTGRTLVGAGTHADVLGLLKTDGLLAAARTPKHKSSVNEGLGHTHGYNDPGHRHPLTTYPAPGAPDGRSLTMGNVAGGPQGSTIDAFEHDIVSTGITINKALTGLTVGPTDASSRPTDMVPFGTANIFIYSGIDPGAAGGGGGSTVRSDTAVVTANLAAAAGESGIVALGKGYRVLRVKADHPCRVRLYTTPAQRTADVARPAATEPPDYPAAGATPNHGCVLEVVLTAAHLVGGQYVQDLAPNVVGSSNEAVPSQQIAYRIDNTDVAAHPITVTFTSQKLESA